jgi:hypothetical protein
MTVMSENVFHAITALKIIVDFEHEFLLQHVYKDITKLKYRLSALRLFLSPQECTPGP